MTTTTLLSVEEVRLASLAHIKRFSGSLTVSLGRSNERFPVRTLAEASEKYQIARDISERGASTMPDARIYNNGKPVARISYNGRVWDLATGQEIQTDPNRPTAAMRELGGWR